MTKIQQRSAWKTLTDMLHDARHGRPVDARLGAQMAEALPPHWPSFELTLRRISQRLHALARA